MRTLRERLNTPCKLVLDIGDAPSYIHNFDHHPEDEVLVVTWNDDGLIYNAEFKLDEESPECGVLQLVKVE